MRKLSKVLILLMVIGVVLSTSACKKDPVIEITEYNVLGEFVDGGDGVYTFETNTEDELHFTYDKSTYTYAYMSASVTEDLSLFKKLVITLEGSGTVLVKLETSDGDSKEVSINVTGITGSYEWNLVNDSDFLANVTSVVLISAPGKEDSVGDIRITEMTFYKEVAENYIIQTGFNNIPQNVNEYDGVSDTFIFNDKWENYSDETYEVVYESDTAVISFDKASGEEWTALKTSVQGDFTEFNYIVLKVSGTEGQKLLAKPSEYNAYENYVFLTGEIQELVLDISDMPTADKNAITEIFVFGAAGLAPITGQFTIHEAFFAKDYTYEAPVIDVNIYDSGDVFDINYWYDGGDNNYTITTNVDSTTIDYDKTSEWSYAIAHIEGDLSVFDYLVIDVTGIDGKTALFKLEGTSGAIEQAVTFDGTRQSIVIDLSTMTAEQLTVINKLLIFAAQGSNIGSGTITLHSVTLEKAGFNFNDIWNELDAGTYNITYDGVKTTVEYTKVAGQEWSLMVADFTDLDVTGLNTLTLVLDGPEGKQVLVKPNDDGALEQWVTFGTEPVTITVTADAFTKVIIFAEAGVAPVTGTFEILTATLTTVVDDEVVIDLTEIYDFTQGNFEENDLGTYTFTSVDATTVVDYVKVAGQEWSFGKILFDTEVVAGFNTMTLTISGPEGKQLLLKPNDNGALEQWITFGVDPVEVVVTAEQFTSLIFFMEAGVTDVSGQFIIHSAVLSHTFSTTDWIDNGDGAHVITVENGVATVTYDKLVGQEWTHIKVLFNAEEVEGLNTLTLILDGPEGIQALVKPNDDGALEQWVTFGTEPVIIEVTATQFTSIIIFVEAGVAPASNSFEIISTELTYVEPAMDLTAVYDFTQGNFEENDLGTYTFTSVDATTVVDYVKVAGQEWSFGKILFDTEVVAGFNTMTLTISGPEGKQLLLKPNDNGALEQWITFGVDPVEVVVTAEQFTSLIFFMEAGVTDVSGQFIIHSAVLSYSFKVETFADNGDGAHVITVENGVATVTYDKLAGQEWTNIRANIDTELVLGLNTMEITLSGTEGIQILLKPNDDGALETWVTLGTEPVTVVITAESFNSIIIFVEPGTAPAAGTYTIDNVVLYFTE